MLPSCGKKNAVSRGADNSSPNPVTFSADTCGLPSSILDALSAHIAVLDIQGTIIFVNRAWRKFAEANHPDPDSVCLGANYFEACKRARGEDASHAQKTLEALQDLLNGKRSSFSIEYPCHSPEERRWFSANFMACYENEELRLVTAHELITEKVIAREKLQAEAQEYRLMFDEAGDGIIIRDETGKILRANNIVEEIFGYSLEELSHLKTQNLLHPYDLQSFPIEEINRRCRAGETLRLERRCFKKDGSRIFVQITIRLINPERGLFQILIRDISDKKRTEQELQRHAEILQTVFDNLPAIIFLLDPEGRMILSNRALETVLDLQANEIGGFRESICENLFTEDADKWRFLDLVSQATGEWVDFRARTKSGRILDTIWAFIRLTDGSTLGIGQDITARKQTEEALKKEHLKLQHMEAELRLAQKLEAVGQLAAGIAHEINTPMQFVGDSVQFLQSAFEDLMTLFSEYRSFAERGCTIDSQNDRVQDLKRREEELDLEYLLGQIPRALERSNEGIKRVTTIVRAMREFAHPDQKEKELDDINRILQNVLTVSRNEYKYVAEVETDFDDHLPPVMCHVGEIGQVFLNLIVNAAHAIGDVVAGTERKGLIRVRTRLNGDHVLIEIEDTGTGIPKEIHQRIFDPFFTTKPVGKGTGQGLSIARSIVVDKHGGKIGFESEVGRGTVFRIELPAGERGG